MDEADEIGVHPKDLALGELVVGQRPAGQRKIRALPNPKTMSEAEWREHMVTHLPYCDGCPFCISGKRSNSHNRLSTRSMTIPSISLDYGFLRDATSQDVVTFLGAYVRPYKIYFAMVVNMKGPDPDAVKRLARWLGELGLLHFTYKADKEPALKALMKEAIARARVRGDKEPSTDSTPGTSLTAAVPEHSHPGESSFNGAAERGAQAIEDHARVLKLALEHRLVLKVPCHAPVMAWLVEHAAM